jgi:hypothetical protein
MQHLDQSACNIRLEQINILNKLLRHISETLTTYVTCATSLIYFCNIHMKPLQHKCLKHLDVYLQHRGDGAPVLVNSDRRVGASGEWRCTSTTSIQHQQRA